MKINLRILGKSTRHITSFEKNTIFKLNKITSVKHVELMYDNTLLDVDDKYYLLLNVKLENGGQITTTTEGETQYEALLHAVELTKNKIKTDSQIKRTSPVIALNTTTFLQRAV